MRQAAPSGTLVAVVRSSSPARSQVFAALAILAFVLLGLRSGLSAGAVLCLAPALLLGAALCLRRYPGERLLLTLRRRGTCPRPRAAASLLAGVSPATWLPRGGLLMAFALAVRPPPVAFPTS